MKRLLCILMAALLMITTTAYAESAGQQNQTFEKGSTEEKLYRMIPVFDSFARSMGIEGKIAYDANNPQFFWTQLYYHGADWSFANELTKYTDKQIILPAELLKTYAAASFAGTVSLPDIPGSVTDISYDAATDTYRLNMPAMPDTFIIVEHYALDADGALLAGIGYYDTYYSVNPTRLGGLLVQMTENAGQDASAEPAFPYSVKYARMESDADFTGLTVTNCSIQHFMDVLQPPGTPAPSATPTPVLTAEPTAALTPAVTSTPVITFTPAPSEYPKLSLGSRGEAVEALQDRLNELGYKSGSSDGVFGANTKQAVRYFQDAIGASQDGVATDRLQQRLFANNAPEYVLYVQLKKGAEGVRVEKLQKRLRELNYLAEPMDGDYGTRTVEAVKLFQKKANLKVDGVAGVRTQTALFKKNAPGCDEYITLKKGDTGLRVKEMQESLNKLGFLAKAANSAYDNDTVKAVEAFLKAIGESGDGKTASPDLLGKLFKYVPPTPAPTATPVPAETPTPTPVPVETPTPTPPPTPTPNPPPTLAPVPPVQVITDEQLNAYTAALNTILGTTNNAAAAVNWLQQKLGITQSGVYDDATKTAVTTYQTNNGLTVTGIPDADTINKLNV